MRELLVNRLFKLAQEKVWLDELTVPPIPYIAVDLGRKATKQANKQANKSKASKGVIME